MAATPKRAPLDLDARWCGHEPRLCPIRGGLGTPQLLALVFERQVQAGAEAGDLSILDRDVELDHLGHPQIAERPRRRLDRSLGRCLPRIGARAHQLRDPIHAVSHLAVSLHLWNVACAFWASLVPTREPRSGRRAPDRERDVAEAPAGPEVSLPDEIAALLLWSLIEAIDVG